MKKLDLSNLRVHIQPPATDYKPVEHRKYTLMQSDRSNEISLTIGQDFNTAATLSKQRDELLAEWIPQMGQYVLLGRMHISDRDFDEQYAKIRYMIYEREADLLLTAILYGDKELLSHYPWLLNSPIYVRFQSDFPEYNKIQYYGTAREYLNKSIQMI